MAYKPLGRDVSNSETLTESCIMDPIKIERHKVTRKLASRPHTFSTPDMILAISAALLFASVIIFELTLTLRLLLISITALCAYLGRRIIIFKLVEAIHNFDAQTKTRRMPKRIILIRHGESQGNAIPETYMTVADNQVPLTERGEEQAKEAGARLRSMIGDETLRFFVSPYKRSWQTFENMLSGGNFLLGNYTVREEPRIREQDWGNFQDPPQVAKYMEERRRFGAFYYRFPHGESGADVYDRVDSFWGSLMREVEFQHCLENFVIVSHGITLRLFLMRYFKWTVQQFHELWNFENCQMTIMELDEDGRYKLITPVSRNLMLTSPRPGA